MTRERQILCAVAGLAALGVMADRVLLSGTMTSPKEASASTVATSQADITEAPVSAATPATVASDTTSKPTVSLAQRLAHVRPQVMGDLPNAFKTPAAWEPEESQTPTITTQNGFNPEQFAKQHPLEAVTAKGNRRSAVVAGDVVSIGESRDGMTLTAIEDGSVIWSGHGVRVRVRLHPR